jgi:hypothetical protein
MEYYHKEGPSLVWDEQEKYREQTWTQLKDRILKTQGGIGTAADDFLEMLRYKGAPFGEKTEILREAFSELVADATTNDDLKLLAEILSVIMLKPWETNIDGRWFISRLRKRDSSDFDAERAALVLNHLYQIHPDAAQVLCVTLTIFVESDEDTLTLWDKIRNTNKLKRELMLLFTHCLYIATEGKSDWKHLKAALRFFQSQGKFDEIDVQFLEDCDPSRLGSRKLLAFCEQLCKLPSSRLIVAVFDRDESDIVKQAEVDGSYRHWGNNVFSVVLPVLPHRQGTPDLCIEFYYSDEDMTRMDAKGRRLFLSREFDERSGRHENGILNCTDLNKLGRRTIIGDCVFDANNNNVALSKDDYAANILDEAPGFRDIDFSSFMAVFQIIAEIAREFGSGLPRLRSTEPR